MVGKVIVFSALVSIVLRQCVKYALRWNVVLRCDDTCKGGSHASARLGLGQCELRPAGSGEEVYSCFGTVQNNRTGVSAPLKAKRSVSVWHIKVTHSGQVSCRKEHPNGRLATATPLQTNHIDMSMIWDAKNYKILNVVNKYIVYEECLPFPWNLI